MLKITTSSKVLRQVSFWIQHDWILGVTKWQLAAHLSAPYLTWFRWVYTNIKMINSSYYKNVNSHLLTVFVVHSGTTDWEAVILINPMIRRWMLPEFWRLTPPQPYDSWVYCSPNTWQKKLNILWRNYLKQTDLMWYRENWAVEEASVLIEEGVSGENMILHPFRWWWSIRRVWWCWT